MTDVHSKEIRSYNMSRIKEKNTDILFPLFYTIPHSDTSCAKFIPNFVTTFLKNNPNSITFSIPLTLTSILINQCSKEILPKN